MRSLQDLLNKAPSEINVRINCNISQKMSYNQGECLGESTHVETAYSLKFISFSEPGCAKIMQIPFLWVYLYSSVLLEMQRCLGQAFLDSP